MSPGPEHPAGMPTVHPFVLGPVETNGYLVGDPLSKQAVVIDPAAEGETIVRRAQREGLQIRQIWLTHGHFDHFGGVAGIIRSSPEPPQVAIHEADMGLWRAQGGAMIFGIQNFEPGPEPDMLLQHGMRLQLGGHGFEVRHTPGHTPGHVIFVSQDSKMVFCGDLIFYMGVGRTDLPGGNWRILLESIRREILALPDETNLFSGHGPATTVGNEREFNPFLNQSGPNLNWR